jgi:hypothetical protein
MKGGYVDFDLNLSSMVVNQIGVWTLVSTLIMRSSEMMVADMVGEEVWLSDIMGNDGRDGGVGKGDGDGEGTYAEAIGDRVDLAVLTPILVGSVTTLS